MFKIHKFETPEFKLEEAGIALLRSKFVYKTIAYQDLLEVSLKRGPVVRNPVAVFLMGVLLLGVGIYFGNIANPFNVSLDSLGYRGGKVLGFASLMILGLIFFGGLLVYKSLKKDMVLHLLAPGFKESYPLTSFRENGNLKAFVSYLEFKTGKKLEVID